MARQYLTVPIDGERWSPIKGFEMYQISDLGRVQSFRVQKRGRPLQGSKDRKGYRQVMLWDDRGKCKGFPIHRLVARAFLGPPPSNQPAVNHKNGIKTDNHFSNLEWCSNAENSRHAGQLGLLARGTSHHRAKLNDDAVREIRIHLQNGLPFRKVARMYGVGKSTIQMISYGRSWKHVL